MKLWSLVVLPFLLMISPGYFASAADSFINEITLESENTPTRKETVHIKMSQYYSPEIFGIEGEKPRLVCDFPNMEPVKTIKHLIETDGKLIHQIRLGVHSTPSPKTRVVLDLIPDQDYLIHQVPSEKDAVFSITVQLATQETITNHLNKTNE